MTHLFAFCRPLRLGFALTLLVAAAVGHAQTPHRSIRAVPQPAAPVMAPAVNPAGLTSRFPAGLPSPLPNPAGLPSPTIPNLASPGTAAGSPPIDAGVVPPTSVMGAGAYGGVAAGRPAATVMVPGPYTALQIAQSFIGADANRDGQLTRGEAQRLTIMPYSFEEMDRNHDGLLTRFEYEDGVR